MARGPDIDMRPEAELRARSEALEGAVQASAAAELEVSHVEGLRVVIGNRWNAFQRRLRRVTHPLVSSPYESPLRRELDRSRLGHACTNPSRPRG